MDRTLLEQSSVFQEFYAKLKALRKDKDEVFHQARGEDLLRAQGAVNALDEALALTEDDEPPARTEHYIDRIDEY